MTDRRRRVRFRWTGCVQGIGLRPALARLASRHGLGGTVANEPGAVVWEWEGEPRAVSAAIAELETLDVPGLRVDGAQCEELPPARSPIDRFTLMSVGATDATSGWSLPPDRAPCPDCLAELADANARRHRYPFLSCTRCGPRWTTAVAPPWTRANTTFAAFPPCALCRAEFKNPEDRRFHAETIACPACGPRLAWHDGSGPASTFADEAVRAAEACLRDGGIVTVLGTGGFHLCVDARSDAAVARLRARKVRPGKPFAVLFPSLECLRDHALSDALEGDVLQGPGRPIVPVRLRPDHGLAGEVAPGLDTVGALLPPTALHHLLAVNLGFPIVCTSGNVAGEPVQWNVETGRSRLAGIADGFLVHDRAIAAPADDPVVRVLDGAPTVVRHGRGTAPVVLGLPNPIEPTRAWGGHLKAAPAVAQGLRAVLAPHVADLDTLAGVDAHQRAMDHLARFEGIPAHAEALHDLHPEYATTRLAVRSNSRSHAVQHHRAHAAAIVAEHADPGPFLAVVWDGAGYAGDGTVRGGEFLARDLEGDWRSAGELPRFRLLGGDVAARDPRRCAYAALHAWVSVEAAEAWAEASDGGFDARERCVLRTMLETGVASPWTTSAGRWFDVVAALLGIARSNTWEGEAAVRLEQAAGRSDAPFPLPNFRFETDGASTAGELLRGILSARRQGVSAPDLAAGFHAMLSRCVVARAKAEGLPAVGLTGGCFVNRVLVEGTAAALRSAGFTVRVHRRVPPGDGGLAYGQTAARAAEGGRDVPGDTGAS
ncbi:MAG: carbamoyltransferase HypF [Armatimonadota bacterium]